MAQPGCLFWKRKPPAPEYPAPAVSVLVFPPNVPGIDPALRRSALAAAVIMADLLHSAPNVTVAPLWEGMRIAADLLGDKRELTEDRALIVANRLGARWIT
ncbi:MAG: hypothetical protein ABIG68_13195, partial [Acidobacteriota bacterium]